MAGPGWRRDHGEQSRSQGHRGMVMQAGRGRLARANEAQQPHPIGNASILALPKGLDASSAFHCTFAAHRGVAFAARRWMEMGDGRWQMADGRWQMVDGRWQVAGGKFHHPSSIIHGSPWLHAGTLQQAAVLFTREACPKSSPTSPSPFCQRLKTHRSLPDGLISYQISRILCRCAQFEAIQAD
jgi:hypothetical protein